MMAKQPFQEQDSELQEGPFTQAKCDKIREDERKERTRNSISIAAIIFALIGVLTVVAWAEISKQHDVNARYDERIKSVEGRETRIKALENNMQEIRENLVEIKTLLLDHTKDSKAKDTSMYLSRDLFFLYDENPVNQEDIRLFQAM